MKLKREGGSIAPFTSGMNIRVIVEDTEPSGA